MHELLETWHLWEKVLVGKSVGTDKVAWLLEDPDEYQLRRLLRTFDERDELLERIGSFLFDAPRELNVDDVTRLAQEHLRELERLARVLELSDIAHSAASARIEIGGEFERPSLVESDSIFEVLFDITMPQLSARLAGWHLREVLYRNSGNSPQAADYLTAPLIDFETNFEACVLLARSGRSVWLDQGTLFVAGPSSRSSNYPDGGWNPQLGWPTEADIVEHVGQERQAMNPKTKGDVLVGLLDSPSTFAASTAAYHPNLPSEVLGDLARSPSTKMRTAAARNAATPGDLLAMLADDVETNVRLGVAVNKNTPAKVIEGFTNEPDSHVLSVVLWSEHATVEAVERAARSDYWRARSAAAEHAKASPELVATLAADDSSDVRARVAQRSDIAASVVMALSTDDSHRVRSWVACNPNAPVTMVERLAADENSQVRYQLADHPELSAATLEVLATDSSDGVRRRVAGHPNTPQHVLESLANDQLPLVASAAQERL